MSTSSNEGIKESEQPAAPFEDDEEEKTETSKNNNNKNKNDDVVAAGGHMGEGMEKSKLRDCCKHYDQILSSTRAGAKVSDRDSLINSLQNQLKNMEDQYKKTLGEQEDIKKKYAETVHRLSKAETPPKAEVTDNKMVEATEESIQLDNLRMELEHRLETGKMKPPKKCCRYLYEALGVEFPPDKKPNNNNKKATKAAESKSHRDKKEENKDDVEECKQFCDDFKPGGTINERAGDDSSPSPKIKERKSLVCRETCKTISGDVPIEKAGLQKELNVQVAMMEDQEKDLNDLQDKLRKLSQSLESFERTKVITPPKGYASPTQKTTALDISCYQKCKADFQLPMTPSPEPPAISDLKTAESTEKLEEAKPDRKEPPPSNPSKKRPSRCCKRTKSQESRKKDKPPPPKERDSSPPKDQTGDKCCDLIECPRSNTAGPSETPPKVKEFPSGDKLRAPPEKSVTPPKTATIDEGSLKKSTPEPEKKEKKKSRCCPRRKTKSQENLGDKSDENCDCGVGNCPVKKGYAAEGACCDLDACPSHRGPPNATKSQEISCCDLEDCPRAFTRDAYTSTCDEICPFSNKSQSESPKKNKDDAKKKELKDAYEKALEANKDLETQIQSQKLAVAKKDEEIEDLQNQLKEIILKNKILLCEFGCKLDELKAGYEGAQNELNRLKENREALNENVEKLKAEYEMMLRGKENEAKELRNKLDAKESEEQSEKARIREMSAELQQKADSDSRALRTCEGKYNELKSEYDYFKEKAAVSENQNALLRQEIADLKDAYAKVNEENKELQSCRMECDKMKDQCYQECKKLKEDSHRRTSELDEIRQEKDNLVRENSQHITGLENKILNLSMEGMAMQDANARLSQELEHAKDGLRNMRHSLGGLAEEKTNLEDELAERQREIRQLEEALRSKSQELDAANEEMVKAENVYKVQVCNLECTLEEQKSYLEDALNKLQAAQGDNNRLSRDLERLEGEHASLNGGLETWKRKYEDDVGALRKELAEAQGELARAEEKLKESEEQLKSAVCDYECKLFELINKYNISQRDLQEHQECRDMLEGKLATSVGQLEKVKLEMADCMKECQQEKSEKVKLRKQLDQSLSDFHEKDKSLEGMLLALEQAKQDKIDVENNLKLTICSYECKINELVAAQESTASELLSLKQEAERATQENQQLKTRLAGKDGELDELKNTVAALRREVEDLRAAKAEADKNNAACASKLEKLTADYEGAQAEIQRLNEMKAAAKPQPPSISSAEKKKESEVEGEPQFKSKCISECKKRCAKPEVKPQKTRRDECRKACGALKKSPGDSQDQFKRPPSQTIEPITTEKADKKLLCKTDQPLNKECRDLCAELKSIKKMLSDIEIVSTPKPTTIVEASESQLVSVVSPPKANNGESSPGGSPPKVNSGDSPPKINNGESSSPKVNNGEKVIVRKSHSWKEEYERTAQERDELKQEINQMYKKLKEVMKELEDKLNV